MKTRKLLATIILTAIMASCGSKGQSTDDIITVDVNANYPEKELILQDFMDVEYIPLETTDEFITQGEVKAIGKKHIVVINWNNDGDIFIYDRSGKGIRKINRKGQSGEEYNNISEFVLDENNNEMFVIDNQTKKLFVFNLNGNFKRNFEFVDSSFYSNTFNYDKNNLITYRGYPPFVETDQSNHIIISKQDGSINQEIGIPYNEIASMVISTPEITVMPFFSLTIPYNSKSWVIARASSDTVYKYQPDDKTMTPLLVRTPFIYAMDPQVFLLPIAITDNYYFIKTVKKEFSIEKMRGYPATHLVYDKKEKAIFKYTLYNDDYTNKEKIILNSNALCSETPILKAIEAADLVEAYENGELKGKLKEIAAELDEEDNPVIMLVKHKK